MSQKFQIKLFCEGKEVGIYTSGFKDIAKFFSKIVSNTKGTFLSQRINKIMKIKEETKIMTWNRINSYIYRVFGTPIEEGAIGKEIDFHTLEEQKGLSQLIKQEQK